MDRIAIFIQNEADRRLLADWLASKYQVVIADNTNPLNGSFDLGILDGPSLQKLRHDLKKRKKSEEPVFLPLLLMTSRPNVGAATHDLWRVVDEVISTPVQKVELQARLEVLLRARSLSVQLKRRNEDLEALVQAVTHDLKAYLRVMLGFNRALYEDQSEKLDQRGLHYIERIQVEGESAQVLVDMLLDFLSLGRKGVRKQKINLDHIVKDSLRSIRYEVKNNDARVEIQGVLPEVQGDPVLLKIALRNLLSNAILYVAPGVKSHVTISAHASELFCSIRVQDNGIGIAPENHERIFQPFVRLHGVEEYPGIGFGLPAVRKAVELMEGRVGLESKPGEGSSFWIELPGASYEFPHN